MDAEQEREWLTFVDTLEKYYEDPNQNKTAKAKPIPTKVDLAYVTLEDISRTKL